MLFPLLLIPLIIERLGLKYFGIYSIIISITNILVLVIDYGFTFTATKDVAKVKHSPKLLSEYFSSVMITQFIVFIITIIVIFAICLLPNLKEYSAYLFLSILALLGYLLNPGWLFQGLETSYISAIINLFFRLLTIVVLYAFLNFSRGLTFFFLIYSLGFLGWGLVSFIVAIVKYSIKLSFIKSSKLTETIKGTSSIFIANLISSLYLSGIPMILNFFSISLTNIASYSIAEKVIRGICSIVSPLSIALIPYFVNRSTNKSEISLINNCLKVAIKISVPFLLVSFFILFGQPQIISIIRLFKHDFSIGAQVGINLKIQCLIIFFSIFNNIVGISSFVSLGYLTVFRNIMLAVIISAMLVFFVLVKSSYYYVGSVTVLFSEVFLTLTLVLYLLYKRVYLKKVEVELIVGDINTSV